MLRPPRNKYTQDWKYASFPVYHKQVLSAHTHRPQRDSRGAHHSGDWGGYMQWGSKWSVLGDRWSYNSPHPSHCCSPSHHHTTTPWGCSGLGRPGSPQGGIHSAAGWGKVFSSQSGTTEYLNVVYFLEASWMWPCCKLSYCHILSFIYSSYTLKFYHILPSFPLTK